MKSFAPLAICGAVALTACEMSEDDAGAGSDIEVLEDPSARSPGATDPALGDDLPPDGTLLDVPPATSAESGSLMGEGVGYAEGAETEALAEPETGTELDSPGSEADSEG